MIFPTDPTVMLLLLALATGSRLDVTEGALTLEVPGVPEPVALAALDEALDALESRGWIAIEAGGPVVTEQGRYAIKRWLARQRIDLDSFELSMRAVKSRA